MIKTAEGEGEEDALFQVFTGGPFAFVCQLNKLYKGLDIGNKYIVADRVVVGKEQTVVCFKVS